MCRILTRNCCCASYPLSQVSKRAAPVDQRSTGLASVLVTGRLIAREVLGLVPGGPRQQNSESVRRHWS
jgi:hypothetical protein